MATIQELQHIFEDEFDHVPMQTISTIVEPDAEGHGLFISSYMGPYNTNALIEKKIGRVVNVGGENRFNEPYKLPPGVEYLYLPVQDEEDFPIYQHFPAALRFIEGGEKGSGKPANTLVHCQLGVSRSVTIVLAFLMKHRNMSLIESARLVKQGRPIAMPNSGFLKQLVEFYESLNAK